MYTINFTESIPNITQQVKQYNQGFILRKGRNGKPCYDLKMALREPHLNLLIKMMVLYGNQIKDFKLIRVSQDLPAFRTNSPGLAESMQCGERSIRSYINRLIEAGFIERKEGRGKFKNYLLSFRDDLFILNQISHPDELREASKRVYEKAERTALIKDLRQTLPPLYPGANNKNKQVLGKTDFGNSKVPASPGDIPGDPVCKMDKPSKTQSPQKEEKGAAAGREISDQETVCKIGLDGGEKLPSLPIPNLQQSTDYVLRLFSLIVSVLYPNRQLKRSQTYSIKLFLYQEFMSIPLDEFRDKYLQLSIRIMLAKKYLEGNHKRFIPLPQKYFDRSFEHGFIGTEEWYQNMLHRTREIEKHQQNSRLFLKAWGGFCQVWRKHLPEASISAYQQGRNELAAKYPDLIDVYDYLFVDVVQSRSKMGATG